jgi:hypothetical protein
MVLITPLGELNGSGEPAIITASCERHSILVNVGGQPHLGSRQALS